MAEQEPWASVENVAKDLGIAKDTVYWWIEPKALAAHKVGWLWKFKPTEVDEWVRSGGPREGEPDACRLRRTASRCRTWTATVRD